MYANNLPTSKRFSHSKDVHFLAPSFFHFWDLEKSATRLDLTSSRSRPVYAIVNAFAFSHVKLCDSHVQTIITVEFLSRERLFEFESISVKTDKRFIEFVAFSRAYSDTLVRLPGDHPVPSTSEVSRPCSSAPSDRDVSTFYSFSLHSLCSPFFFTFLSFSVGLRQLKLSQKNRPSLGLTLLAEARV